MYFVPVDPGSAEHSTYNRFAVAFVWTTREVRWGWRFESPYEVNIPRARMVVDGVPATDWIDPTAGVYRFQFSVENGHHVAFPEIERGGHTVLAKPFLVNDTGSPLSMERQTPWVAATRLEGGGQAPQQVTYRHAAKPFAAPMKPRVIEPYSSRLPKNKLWARRWTQHQRNVMFRRFEHSITGDVIVVPEQKYSYGNAISLGAFTAGLIPPQTVCRDGPRNWSTLGYIGKLLLRRGGKGVYFLETNGRVGFMQFGAFSAPESVQMPDQGPRGGEGRIDTWAGWRIAEDGMRTFGGSGDAGWEFVGDWSRVPGVKKLHECWGLAVAFRRADGSIDNRDGLDLWVADTLNHRILFLDAWAAHPDVSSVTKRPAAALFPPAGYVTPSERGRAALVPFAGSADQTASEFVNEPWDCEVRPQDGKLYWSNFGGDSICRANLDGSGVERVVGFAPPKSDSALGIPSRLYPSSQSLATLRSWQLSDGDVARASCTRPQAIAFDADGNLYWCERYTYTVRKLDFATGQVTTLIAFSASSLSLTSSSSSTQDMAMCIDVDGTCGPRGDIFVSMWAHSAFRFAKDGTAGERFGFQSGAHAIRNGPWDVVDGPNYAWGIAAQEGRIIWAGNDSGSQFIEVTKRQPGDPGVDVAKHLRGMNAYWAAFLQTHGAFGYGELAFPNVEAMGAWPEVQLRTYATQWGVPAGALDDFVYWVRWQCIDFDYTTTVPPDNLPPAAPISDLIITIGA